MSQHLGSVFWLHPLFLVPFLRLLIISIELTAHMYGFPRWLSWERIRLQCRRPGFDPWVGKMPWRRKRLPTPVFLPEKSHGWRSLVGYSPWGRKELDTTERLHFHFKQLSAEQHIYIHIAYTYIYI